ncbi:MAG: hypothetical protein GY851_28230 [bacterium]|nr:hypothetical protein [bacterium]
MTARHGVKVTGWMIAGLLLTLVVAAGAAEEGSATAVPAPVAAPAPAPAGDGAAPALAARIGDKAVITKAEFDTQLDRVKMQSQAHGNVSPKRLLDSMIDSKLIYVLAVDSGLKASENDIADQIEGMRKQVEAAKMEFEDALKRQGLTLAILKEKIAEGMVQQKYVENMTKDLVVPEEELTEFYTQLKEAGRLEREEETVDVAHILITVPKGSAEDVWAGAKTRIDAARKRVVDGEAFGDVANDVSEDPGSNKRGGTYTEIGPNSQYVQEFKDAALSLDVGGMSDPFKTQFGWHILTVNAKHPKGTLALEDVRDVLEQQLKEAKEREAIMKIIADAREKYPVEILIELKEPAPQMMPQLAPPVAPAPAPPEGSS